MKIRLSVLVAAAMLACTGGGAKETSDSKSSSVAVDGSVAVSFPYEIPTTAAIVAGGLASGLQSAALDKKCDEQTFTEEEATRRVDGKGCPRQTEEGAK